MTADTLTVVSMILSTVPGEQIIIFSSPAWIIFVCLLFLHKFIIMIMYAVSADVICCEIVVISNRENSNSSFFCLREY